jgi:hypothetical protein
MELRNRVHLFIMALLFLTFNSQAQYAPVVGQPGSTAISKDSIIILGWATQCTVSRGWQNISNQSLGKTTEGNPNSALGKADNNVISLGDGGTAVLQFAQAISNGIGPDFAVFENAFDDLFLELAFVEVSSDGQNYFRFPAHSLTQTITQVGGFGQLQTTQINNLAGKYRGGYGTPFDLEELKNTAGLDVMHITHIRVIDVVGSINDAYARFDTANNKINDPFPTPFPSGGFDLDAVGVMHITTGINHTIKNNPIEIYPNPSNGLLYIDTKEGVNMKLISMQGQLMVSKKIVRGVSKVDIHDLPNGVYILRIENKQGVQIRRIVKN